MSSPEPGVVLNAAPKTTKTETHGIATIPHEDRTSGWFDLMRMQFGGANTFATALFGSVAVSLGLSFWQAVAAVVLGVAVGTAVLAPMGLYGPRTGTNNAVSSGAILGVKGRIAGSLLSFLTAVAFYSISVWVGGDAIVGALTRITDVSDSTGLRTAIYAAIGFTVIVVVTYGYQFMLMVNKIAVITNTVLMLLAFVAFAGSFDPSYSPGPDAYALGSFWPTFVAAALVAMSNPISFGAFLGDWSRYIPADTPQRKIIGATFLAQGLTLVPFLFGVATATLVFGEEDYVVALIQVSPGWYAALLIVVAFIGGMSTGTTALYGTGLDFSSVFPRFSRVQSTIGLGAVAFLFIVTGRLFFDLLEVVNAFVGAILVTTTPWIVIMTLGYVFRRGFIDADAVQVFNQRKKGGRYWFRDGVNWRAMCAWLLASVLGLLFASFPPIIVGPFADLGGGMDLSLVVAVVSAVILYTGLLFLFPEPDYAYSDRGSFLVPTRSEPVPAVIDE